MNLGTWTVRDFGMGSDPRFAAYEHNRNRSAESMYPWTLVVDPVGAG
jgi:hypothetical protein